MSPRKTFPPSTGLMVRLVTFLRDLTCRAPGLRQLSGVAVPSPNGEDEARSCLFSIEKGGGRKIAGLAPAARSPTRLPGLALIAAASDRRRRPAGRSAALPLDQVAKAFRQDQGRGAHLDDLDFASRDEKVEGTATYAREPTCVWNAHADGLDGKR